MKKFTVQQLGLGDQPKKFKDILVKLLSLPEKSLQYSTAVLCETVPLERSTILVSFRLSQPPTGPGVKPV